MIRLVGGIASLVAVLAAATGGSAPAEAAVPAGLLPGLCLYTPDLLHVSHFVGYPPNVATRPAPTTAVIETNRGNIVVALDAAAAPCTVNSFAFLAGKQYFENNRCHRMLNIAQAGVLQCGDPTESGAGGPGYEFGDENLRGASYPRGELAMANRGTDTNGSQFFLVFRECRFPPSYTPFGRITAGLEILDAVAAKGTSGEKNDRPRALVRIRHVTVS